VTGDQTCALPISYHLGPVSYKEYPCQDLKQNTGFWYIDIYNAP